MIRHLIFAFAFFLLVFDCNAFTIKLKRDPFMDLIKLQELKAQENVVIKKNRKNQEEAIKRMIESVVNSITVKMVVYSKENPDMDAALIVGPSGEPIVVKAGYKLSKDVYVYKITNGGIVLSFKTQKGTKYATVRMKNE